MPLFDQNSAFKPMSAIAGSGIEYIGSGDSLVLTTPGDLFKVQNVTISAWIKPSEVDVNGGEIVSMGDSYLLRVLPDSTPMFALFPNPDSAVWLVEIHDTISVIDGNWHYVCGTYDGVTMKLFIDGTQRSSYTYSRTIPYINGENLVIGRHGDEKPGYQYQGGLDELRIRPFAETNEQIRMNYECTKQNAQVISVSVE